ncbi:trypco2 family protein [Streptomyces macrosporus]|uniref:Trypsin-co-occurring domain-containing protein n=1 Tax=Streptomyces macrosporus TaxID=44032 RepID=A0ABN3KP89_9ACTN
MEIELTEAVAALRDSLMDAASRGAGRDVAFEVGPIEMEFQVELRQEVRGKSGFRAWVLAADAEGGVARGRGHRVALTLTPRRAGGGPVLVSAAEDAPAPEPSSDDERRFRRR